MAIVIKVKADVKEMQADIEAAAKKAGDALKTGLGDVGDGKAAKGLKEMTDRLKEMKVEADALRGKLDTLKTTVRDNASAIDPAASNLAKFASVMRGLDTPLQSIFRGMDQVADVTKALGVSVSSTTLLMGGLVVAAAGAAVGLVAMAKAGDSAADSLIKLAEESGKTLLETQKLVIGTTDFTNQLQSLGGVLSNEVVLGASRAFDQFDVLERQMQSMTILIADRMKGELNELGIFLQSVARFATGAAIGILSFTSSMRTLLSTTPVGMLISGGASLFQFMDRVTRPSPGPPAGPQYLSSVRNPAYDPRDPNSQRFLPAPFQFSGGIQVPGQVANQLFGQNVRAPRTPRARRARSVETELTVTPGAQSEIDRLELAFDFEQRATDELYKLQVENIRERELLLSKQKVLAEKGLLMTKLGQQITDEIVTNANRQVELLGARLTQLQNLPAGPRAGIPLAETPTPPLGGVPGIPLDKLQDMSTVTVRLTEQTSVYRHEWEKLSEVQKETLTVMVEAEEHLAKIFELDPLEHRARVLDAIAQRTKTTTEIIANAQISAMDSVFSAIDTGFDRMTASLGAMGRILSQVLSDISRQLLSSVFGRLFLGTGGGGGTGGFGGGGGGGLSALLGGGGGGTGGGGGFVGAIQRLFTGGGGGGAQAAAIGLPASVSAFSGVAGGDFAANLTALSLGQTPTAGLGAAAGGFSFAGLGAGLAGLAPIAGGFAGAALGGKSVPGQILGAVGGSFAGLAIGAALAPSALGGVFAALGILGPLGAALAIPALIGAYFLGKAKQRKADESAADQIWVEEREQVRQLIAAVNADRMDGGEALFAWSQIRAQTVQRLNQIKTASVRESRLTNQLRDLDQGVVAELRAAAQRQQSRRGVLNQLIPEFQGGGYVPGIDRGFDSVPILARPGELVLNRQQQGLVERSAPGVFQQAGIMRPRGASPASSASSPALPTALSIRLAFEGDAAAVIGNIIVKGVETSNGQRAIVNVIKSSRKNGDL